MYALNFASLWAAYIANQMSGPFAPINFRLISDLIPFSIFHWERGPPPTLRANM